MFECNKIVVVVLVVVVRVVVVLVVVDLIAVVTTVVCQRLNIFPDYKWVIRKHLITKLQILVGKNISHF